MGHEAAVAGAIEVIGLLIRGILALKRTAELSDEDLQRRFDAAKAEFDANDPADLPQV